MVQQALLPNNRHELEYHNWGQHYNADEMHDDAHFHVPDLVVVVALARRSMELGVGGVGGAVDSIVGEVRGAGEAEAQEGKREDGKEDEVVGFGKAEDMFDFACF